MSRTPGNPPAPVNSAVHIVGVYSDPAILDWPVRAYGHHAPGVGYLLVDNADRSAGHYIIIQSFRQEYPSPARSGTFCAVAVAGLAQFMDKPLEGLSWLVGR